MNAKNRKIILASSSPRRQEILTRCGYSFDIDAADIDETVDNARPAAEEIRRLAYAKAAVVLDRHPDAIIIGADTVIELDGKIYGKPKDDADACRILGKLNGTLHHVINGLCVMSAQKCVNEVSVNTVHMVSMSEEEIRRYVATGEPRGKAGAYAIQGIAGRYIDYMEGDYSAVVGLSMHRIYEILEDF